MLSGLEKPGELQVATEALRGLVKQIAPQSSPESDKLDIILEGALSGLVTSSLTSKNAKGLTV